MAAIVMLRNLATISSMKIEAWGGANLVPIAALDICLQMFSSNSKQLFLRINSATEIISLLGTLQMPISLSLFLKGALSGLRQFLGTQSPLKRWKVLFISPRKLFPFSRYLNFCLDFLVMYRNCLIKKID